MGKLHELLAVEGDLKGKADKIASETLVTFSKKHEHFFSLHKTYKPDNEAEAALEHPVETKPMVETVKEKLAYTAQHLAEYFDAMALKEITNTQAKADLALEDGTVIAAQVPATLLLALETRFKALRAVYEAIPTLPPGEDWERHKDSGLYTSVEKKVRTRKLMKNHEIAKATDKHPAQVQVYTEDERTGLSVTTKQASVLSPLEKSEILARLDNLLQSVKKARQRANSTEVIGVKFARKLFDYINLDKKPA